MVVSELWKLPAHEVVSLLRTGALGPVEALDAAIARIEDVDGAINALPIRALSGPATGRRSLIWPLSGKTPKA